MKNPRILILSIMVVALSCDDEYIDSITPVAPGPDEAAPELVINYPAEGALIRVADDVTPIDISLEASDDIEIQSVSLSLNGEQIATFNEFKDYRRAILEYTYENLTNGDHVLSVTVTDLSGKSTVQSVNFEKVPPYQPIYAGEVFYLPFDGDYMELVRITNATRVGNPGFAGEGVKGGNAYAGASGAYLTFPTAGLLDEEFSAVFWYKLNPNPDRAGLLVMSPLDPDNPEEMNNRTSGFRFFREGSASNQTFKLNVGDGTADTWFDGGAAASVDPAVSDWIHLAFTISQTSAAVYINGELVKEETFDGVSWTGCDLLSIASGAPRFAEWGHLSDASFMDELRLFNKALSQDEILEIMNAEMP